MNLFLTLTGHLDAGAPFLLTESKTWTFGDLLEVTERMAGSLEAAGVEPGDRVVVVLRKSPYAVAVYLACLRIGAIYVPINPDYTSGEVSFFIEDAAPTAIISEGELPGCQPGTAAAFTLATDGSGSLLASDSRFEGVQARDNRDIAAILYTSGTTGRSKGAMLTHGCLADNARVLYETWHWQTNDVLLHALPIFHVHGLFVALHCALLGGSRVVFLDRFDPVTVRQNLPAASVMMGVPTFYSRLLGDPDFGSADTANMRLFVSGSAPLTEQVSVEFTQRTGHQILERYGMTEAGMICSNPYEGSRVPGTVGFALSGYEVRVAGAEDQPMALGEAGILQIRGPSLFAGYWQLPDATAASLTNDGFFRTGDLASIDLDGRVTLLGRSHDLIITGGFNVYPREIERVLHEVHGVSDVAVVGISDDDLGEVPVAFVVAEADIDALQAHAAEKLARYKQPRQYVFVDELPRNAMGKVQKVQLRDHL